jgi:hypothetical protein
MKLTLEMEVHRGPDQAHANLYLLGDRGKRHPILEQPLGVPYAEGLEERAFHAVAECLDAMLSGDQATEQPHGEPLLVAEPITQTKPVVLHGEYQYEVVATEADGTELRFNYTHHAREPLGVGDTFSLRHGALDLMSVYRVTRVVSDSAVEAEWLRGGGPRYPSS